MRASVSGDDGSVYPSLSADGRYQAFTSNADNLVTRDLVTRDIKGNPDVFVRHINLCSGGLGDDDHGLKDYLWRRS